MFELDPQFHTLGWAERRLKELEEERKKRMFGAMPNDVSRAEVSLVSIAESLASIAESLQSLVNQQSGLNGQAPSQIVKSEDRWDPKESQKAYLEGRYR